MFFFITHIYSSLSHLYCDVTTVQIFFLPINRYQIVLSINLRLYVVHVVYDSGHFFWENIVIVSKYFYTDYWLRFHFQPLFSW